MRKLPVLAALQHALKSTWHNLGFAFSASLPWLVILIPLNIWADTGNPVFDPATMTPEQMPEMQAAMLKFYATTFLSMLIYSSIGVTWHRYILNDEMPTGMARLRIDSLMWRYVGNTLLVGAFVVLALLPFALLLAAIVSSSGGLSPPMFAGYMALVVMVAMPVTYRFSVKLPAIALGRKDFRFGDAWNATRGNMTQFMALGALSFGVVLAVGSIAGLVESLLTAIGGTAITYAFIVIRQLLGWVMGIFAITLLTSLYGFFVEKRDF